MSKKFKDGNKKSVQKHKDFHEEKFYTTPMMDKDGPLDLVGWEGKTAQLEEEHWQRLRKRDDYRGNVKWNESGGLFIRNRFARTLYDGEGGY